MTWNHISHQPTCPPYSRTSGTLSSRTKGSSLFRATGNSTANNLLRRWHGTHTRAHSPRCLAQGGTRSCLCSSAATILS